MKPERHQRKSELFLQAIDLQPEQREAFLNDVCADDPELRREIERMIELDHEEFLEQPALGTQFDLAGVKETDEADLRQSATEISKPLNREIGNYHIHGVLGEGGMGVVYRAEQINPQRPVALKVLRHGVADRETIRRFELEAQVLGRLQHPNIAYVYEAGSFEHAGTGRQQPFLAMELVDGKPLPEYVRDNTLNVTARIELMLQVCDAVEHAHQRGVIHRDLKPANILVQPSGQVKVLDFGIARVTADDWQVTLATNKGQLLGTLAYMSPEQFEFDSAEIDTRADVYALGVVLYELLTGTLPHDVHGKSLPQVIQVLRDEMPKSLSRANRMLRGDLSVIVGKALDRDRNCRYASVSAVAADLRRYLAGEPIMARPHTTWYHLRTFARRNRSMVSAAAMILLALIAGLASTSWHLAETQRAHREAEQARAEAVQARDQERLRARELEIVTDFQAAMLSDIDVHLMGVRLREDLIEEFRAVHTLFPEDAPDAAAVDEMQAEFERHLTGISFTTAAQKGLQRHVFERAIKTIERDLADQPLITAQLLQSIADSLESLDLHEHAMHAQEQALTIRREMLGNDHPDTLTSVLAMGYLLLGAGRYAEAEEYYKEALDGRRRVLGPDHPDTFLAQRRIAALYGMIDRTEEAVAAGRAALQGLRHVLGEDDLRTIDALHTMAPLMYRVGDLEAALEYNRRALEGRARLLGWQHPETLISLNNMGILLASHGRIEEAIEYLERALEGRRRVLGRHHRLTLQSMANMARGKAELGHYDDALRITRDVLDTHLQIFGERHHHTLSTMNNLGEIFMQAGRFKDAEEHVMRAFELHQSVYGNNHPESLRSALTKIRLLRKTARLTEAVEMAEDMLPAVEEMFGGEHLLRNLMLAEHAAALAAMERFAEAEPLMLEAHRMVARIFGSDHIQTELIAARVIDLYAAWSEFDTNIEIEQRLAEWRAEDAN